MTITTTSLGFGQITVDHSPFEDWATQRDADFLLLDQLLVGVASPLFLNATRVGVNKTSSLLGALSVKAFDSVTNSQVQVWYAGDDRTLELRQPDNADGNDPWVFETNNAFAFAVDETTVMILHTNLFVGIGTISPLRQLEVAAATGDVYLRIHALQDASGVDALLEINTENSTDGISYIYFGDKDDHNVGQIRYDHATDSMDFFTSGLERMMINLDGQVGINDVGPDAQLDIVCRNSTTTGLIVDSAASQTNDLVQFRFNGSTKLRYIIQSGVSELQLLATDLGNDVRGPFLFIGRNTNGTQTSGGNMIFEDLGGTDWSVHVDNSGIMRIGTPIPIGSKDTDNDVVGLQTSYRDAKKVLGKWDDPTSALNDVLKAEVYKFTYKSGAYNGEEFAGIITDYAPWAGMDKKPRHPTGQALNSINLFGRLILSVQALEARIRTLEK